MVEDGLPGMGRRIFLWVLAMLPVTAAEAPCAKDSAGRKPDRKRLVGKFIHYPYYGGGDRPMIYTTHRVVEQKEEWLRVDRPGDRQPWVRLDKNVTVVEP